MNEDIKSFDKPETGDTTPVWVQNEHGVKSCWPKHLALNMVKKNYGWEFCVPEEVPKQKQYPLGMGEFTPAGLQRRLAAQESQRIANEMPKSEKQNEYANMSYADLKGVAKKAGIDKYWLKSHERLLKELKEQ